jgi:hypothetical protein
MTRICRERDTPKTVSLFRPRKPKIHVPEITLTARVFDGDEPLDFSEGIELERDECDYRTSEGALLHGRGFRIVTSAGHRELTWTTNRDLRALWDELGVLAVRVAGVSHHREHAQADAFEPGRRVELKHERGAGGDENAVSIWDEHRELSPGWVPRAVSAQAASMLRDPKPPDARTIWEWRNESGERTGIRAIICPEGMLRAS